MKVSRRHFLGGVAASAGALSFRRSELNNHDSRSGGEVDRVVVLDLNCVLRESLQGYQQGLANKRSYVVEEKLESLGRYGMAIVPGVGTMDGAVAQKLCDLVTGGALLLLESGGGFLSGQEFSAQREVLRRYFALAVEPPVELWPEKADHAFSFARRKADHRESVPYVHYVWPRETRVRDFSRAVPVTAKGGDIIGRVGPLPVAVKKGFGNGTLIFLGSPLGPGLGAGDLEARAWLRSVTYYARATHA
jgi:hypothetical protein